MSVQTRRALFRQALAVPFAGQLVQASVTVPALLDGILSGDDCLSEESAAGYRSILREGQLSHGVKQLIIVAGARNLPEVKLVQFRSRVTEGAWLVWESRPQFGKTEETEQQVQSLQSAFGLRFTREDSRGSMYARYRWPLDTLVRTFGAVSQVECTPEEAIAYHDGLPIAMKRSIGYGGVVFLGSMLGPHLAANDREAQELTRRLVKALSRSKLVPTERVQI